VTTITELPANWQEVAARTGHDPQEVQFQKDTYGWTVGTEVQEVPPVELVYVKDLTPWVILAWFTLLTIFGSFAVTTGWRLGSLWGRHSVNPTNNKNKE